MNHRLHLSALLFAANLLAAAVVPAATVFPGERWEEATPESQGVDSVKLQAAADLLARTLGKDGARELVIVRHGRIIWKGNDIDKQHGVWSATKSFTSTVLGLLIADGKCTLDTRVADVLPDLKAVYPDVTLRHFTTMTSGYRAVGDETTGSYRHGPSSTPFIPNPRPLFTPPGSQYAYWDSAMNTLALALTKLAGEPIEDYFRRRVAQPIGMKQWDWGDYATVEGVVVNGGSGNGNKHLFITARELARFGLLFLNRGRWSGRQLVPESWVADATRVHVPATMPWAHPESDIDGRGCYGFNWWRNGIKTDGTRKFPGAPEGMFWASGHNNNKCFVIPEWDMVIVRLGLDGTAKDDVWDGFIAKVDEALQPKSKSSATPVALPAQDLPQRTHSVFSMRPDNTGTLLHGKPFLAVGLRLSNGLISDAKMDELITNLDMFMSYGVNTLSVFFQGSRFGDVRGYGADAALDLVYARRMGRIIEAADARGMVVLVGCLYHGDSQGWWRNWKQADAERAVANTVRWLKEHDYRNVFIDVNNEHMANFDDEKLIAAGKAVDASFVITTSGKVTPRNADLSIHHGSPNLPDKYYIETEGTGGNYWGSYSKQPGLYDYINIGVYTDALKTEMLHRTDEYLDRGQGYLFASTWLQNPPPGGPNHTPGGLGTKEDPGVRWWLEHIQARFGPYRFKTEP